LSLLNPLKKPEGNAEDGGAKALPEMDNSTKKKFKQLISEEITAG